MYRRHTYICIYAYIYIYIYTCISLSLSLSLYISLSLSLSLSLYIYIYIHTAAQNTKYGSTTSVISISRGGILMSIGNLPEIMSQWQENRSLPKMRQPRVFQALSVPGAERLQKLLSAGPSGYMFSNN